jgi:hypothetical protein
MTCRRFPSIVWIACRNGAYENDDDDIYGRALVEMQTFIAQEPLLYQDDASFRMMSTTPKPLGNDESILWKPSCATASTRPR